MILRTLTVLSVLLALVGCSKEPVVQEHWDRAAPWEAETLDAFGALPVQHGGRVKPLSAYAHYKLIQLSGRSSLEVHLPEGHEREKEKLKGVGFLLDCLLFPEQAAHYDVLLVQDWKLLDDLGLERVAGKKRRDVYSLNELSPVIGLLDQEATTLRQRIGSQGYEPTPFELTLLGLHSRVLELAGLIDGLAFARRELAVDPALAEYVPAAERGVATALQALQGLDVEVLRTFLSDPNLVDPVQRLYEGLESQARWMSRELALFPPLDTDPELEWMDCEQVIEQIAGVTLREDSGAYLTALERLEQIAVLGDDQPALREALTGFQAEVDLRREARGEGKHLGLEGTLIRTKPFLYSMVAFVAAFLMAVLTWGTGSRKLAGTSWGFVLSALGLVAYGVTLRCIVNQRPPVTTLYETCLFITFMAVALLLVLERIDKRRLFLGLASFVGIVLTLLGFLLERKAAMASGDTLVSLVAVLDTNYYLWIHVTTVTLGYAAGVAAWFVAALWIALHLAGRFRKDPQFGRFLNGLLYGAIVFGLLFSIFGTLMGGVWANDSWGRFWGWDPKENGALMICLWELMIVHGRLGGLLRQLGTAVAALIGGCVVAFSWFHVNELGVGLHAYGSIDGVLLSLYIFYGFNALLAAVTGVHWLVTRDRSTPTPRTGS